MNIWKWINIHIKNMYLRDIDDAHLNELWHLCFGIKTF